MASMEERLKDAARGVRVEEVEALLRDHPDFNFNWQDPGGWTALHSASIGGHVEVVKLLLVHPVINVNAQTLDGSTPILFGCFYGKVSTSPWRTPRMLSTVVGLLERSSTHR